MDSAPRTSDEENLADRSMGRAITARMQPRLTLTRPSRQHPRPGHLMRSTRSFGLRLGLSQQSRQQLDRALLGSAGQFVRPPIQYWPWADLPEDQATDSMMAYRPAQRKMSTAAPVAAAAVAAPPPPAPTKADRRVAALKQMIMGTAPQQTAASPAARDAPGEFSSPETVQSPTSDAPNVTPPVVRRTVHRGLPLTPRRHGNTWAGSKTSPGGMAGGAAPQPTASVAPSRFETSGPEPLPSIVNSGLSDANPAPASGTSSARRGATISREQQLRRMLESSGAMPTATGPGESSQPQSPTGTPGAMSTPAERFGDRRPGPRAEGELGGHRAADRITVGEHVGALRRAVAASVIGAPTAARVTGTHVEMGADAPRRSPLAGTPQPLSRTPAIAGSLATLEPVTFATESPFDGAGSVMPPRGVSAGVEPSSEGLTGRAVAPSPLPRAARPGPLERATRHRRAASLDPSRSVAITTSPVLITAGHRRMISRAPDGQGIRWTDQATTPVTTGFTDEPFIASPPPGAPSAVEGRSAADSSAWSRPGPGAPIQRAVSAPTHYQPDLFEQAVVAPPAAVVAGDMSDATPASGIAGEQPRVVAPHAVAPAADATSPDVARRARAAAATGGSPDDSAGSQQPPSRWVPAQPGAFFSSHTGKGLLHRGSLLQRLADTPYLDIPQLDIPQIDVPRLGTLRRHSTAPSESAAGDEVRASRRDLDPGATGHDAAPRGNDRADRAPARLGQQIQREHVPETQTRTPLDRHTIDRTGAPLVDHAQMAVAPATPPAADAAGGPIAAPAAPRPVDLADRFLTELSRHRQEQARPLPIQFQSIADVIVAGRRPMISTGLASQRALAAVNKVAATTGDVIHLAERPTLGAPTSAMTAVIAHELTHVANPSPAPRFFDDDRHSAEEQRATEIGEIMRRSPVLPRLASGGATMTTTRDSTPTIRRTVETAGSSHANVVDRIRESPHMSSAPIISRALDLDSRTGSSSVRTSGNDREVFTQEPAPATIGTAEFERLLRSNFDVILELLEDRIITEIERRGGRFRGDF